MTATLLESSTFATSPRAEPSCLIGVASRSQLDSAAERGRPYRPVPYEERPREQSIPRAPARQLRCRGVPVDPFVTVSVRGRLTGPHSSAGSATAAVRQLWRTVLSGA